MSIDFKRFIVTIYSPQLLFTVHKIIVCVLLSILLLKQNIHVYLFSFLHHLLIYFLKFLLLPFQHLLVRYELILCFFRFFVFSLCMCCSCGGVAAMGFFFFSSSSFAFQLFVAPAFSSSIEVPAPAAPQHQNLSQK